MLGKMIKIGTRKQGSGRDMAERGKKPKQAEVCPLHSRDPSLIIPQLLFKVYLQNPLAESMSPFSADPHSEW